MCCMSKLKSPVSFKQTSQTLTAWLDQEINKATSQRCDATQYAEPRLFIYLRQCLGNNEALYDEPKTHNAKESHSVRKALLPLSPCRTPDVAAEQVGCWQAGSCLRRSLDKEPSPLTNNTTNTSESSARACCCNCVESREVYSSVSMTSR